MLGSVFAQELMLSDEEAHNMAQAMVAYARHHDIAAQAKTVDLINLVTVVGGTYGVRFMAIKARRAGDKAEAKHAAEHPYTAQSWPMGLDANGQPVAGQA